MQSTFVAHHFAQCVVGDSLLIDVRCFCFYRRSSSISHTYIEIIFTILRCVHLRNPNEQVHKKLDLNKRSSSLIFVLATYEIPGSNILTHYYYTTQFNG